MEHLMACRICLATDVKLYDMCQHRLKTAYEDITGFNMTQSDCLQHVCSYCGTLLKKFTIFKEKCARSQQVLELLLAEHVLVTMYHIKSINRHSHNLTYPYTTEFIQNFDYSVLIKEEICENNVKPDIDDVTEDFDFGHYENHADDIAIKNDDFDDDISYTENIQKIENDVILNDDLSKNAYDSDEEPLSKKVKKRKCKKSKREPKREKIDVKSETDENVIKNSNLLEVTKREIVENCDGTEHKLVILSKQEQIEEVMSRKSSSNYQNSVYKCDSCFKGFMTEATYKNHMVRHDPSAGSACCDVCHTRWPDARSLRAHALISHERKYICKVCGHVSKSNHKAKEHVSWHAGVTFPCRVCGLSFERSTSYLTHVRLRHPSPHVCAACGETFIGENGLNMHRKKAHRGENSSPPTCQVYECERCHIQFRSNEALQRHSTLTEEMGCDDSLWACAHCGDNFDTESLLKEHADVHQKVLAVRTCAECSRTFANERSLAVHHQRAHGGARCRRADRPRNCVCEICGYKCTSASSLAQHQRRHSGEKPYPCALCPARFSVYQRLQIHVRTHTGERPFACARCPKAFKHKAALNRHDRVHTGVKPYTCPQCGKSFSQSNSMKQHCAGVHMKMYIYSRRAANKQAA